MQNLTKKQVSNDPNRFQADGVTFKGKLIGITDVPELKGDKMCFDAMQKLKADVLRRGEHKQRIFISISVDGVKLRKNENEKMEDLWHHHEVRCISFIWRDPSDARAFGYVTALTAETKRQFVAIKTERAADQVLATLKDLFQVIVDLKKDGNAGEQAQTQSDGTTESAAVASTATEAQSTPATAATSTPSVAQPPAPAAAKEPAPPAPAAAPAADLLGDWDLTPAPATTTASKAGDSLLDMAMAPPAPPPAALVAPAASAAPAAKESDDLKDLFGGASFSPMPAYRSQNLQDLFAPAAAEFNASSGPSWNAPVSGPASGQLLFGAPQTPPVVPPRNVPPGGFPNGSVNPFFMSTSIPNAAATTAYSQTSPFAVPSPPPRPFGSNPSLAPFGMPQSPGVQQNAANPFASWSPPAGSGAGFGGSAMGSGMGVGAGFGGSAMGPAAGSGMGPGFGGSSMGPAAGSGMGPGFGGSAMGPAAGSGMGPGFGGSSMGPAAGSVANPFGERGSTPTTPQVSMSNPFFSAPKDEPPFFNDLVAAGKEMYGVWPEVSKPKPVERPKALQDLGSQRTSLPNVPLQPTQPTQPLQPQLQPFGGLNLPPSGGNLLD